VIKILMLAAKHKVSKRRPLLTFPKCHFRPKEEYRTAIRIT